MNAYLLEWNPDYWPWEKVKAEREEARQSGSSAIRWDVGGNTKIQTGDRAFMMRVGNNQGITGAGWIVSSPAQGPHWRTDKPGETYSFVMVVFDDLYEHPLVRLDELSRPPFGGHRWTPHQSGTVIPELFATALESRWSAVAGEALLVEDQLSEDQTRRNKDGEFIPSDLEDARKRIVAAIVVRQGQGEFRKGLLEAYQRSCAITGCNTVEALEAAHLVPYLGPITNCVTNGVLLRADIHTLFDLGLLSVNPDDYRILISKRLAGSPYQELAGQQMRLPVDNAIWPSCQALKARLGEFRAKEMVDASAS